MVNNAGITRDRMLFNMTDEDWDAVIAVHLRGHFLLTRNAATYWRSKAKETGGTVYGRIINTSSEAGPGRPGRPGELRRGQGRHHRADADGCAGARPLRRAGQRHRAACPDRDDRRRVRRRARARRRSGRRRCRPSTSSTLVRYLASPAAEEVNGQLFIVYGPTVTLVAAPTAERQFTADSDAWDPPTCRTLHEYFAGRDPERGFLGLGLMGSRD